MGAFNVLQAEVICPMCRRAGSFTVQFKYGATWQYNYNLGDRLRWGKNDKGVPGAKRVVIEGVGGPCPNCGEKGLDFDILVESDTLVKIKGVGRGRVDRTPDGFVVLRDTEERP